MANTTGDTPVGAGTSKSIGQWAVAWAALWFVLVLLVDFGEDTAELSAAFAVLIAGTATFKWLPAAINNFQKGAGQ